MHLQVKKIESIHFYALHLESDLPPGSIIISSPPPPDRGELLIPHQTDFFFENLLPPSRKGAGRNYDLLYQNSVRKYENDLEY